jgi:uncharacterized protein DUF4082/MBG domain-containing protein/Big-like domain-containing protein
MGAYVGVFLVRLTQRRRLRGLAAVRRSPVLAIAIAIALGLLGLTATSAVADPAACPCSLFPASTVPTIETVDDPNAVELGVGFYSDTSGYIDGIRFYKSAANTGVHVGSLWTTGGALLAQATFISESASGWQEVDFPTPVAITSNTMYVASYHTNTGDYSATPGFFTTSDYDNPPLHAPGNTSNPNGLFAYSPVPTFPTGTFNGNNYDVDVVFTQSPLPASITATAPNAAPAIGTTEQLQADAFYGDGTSSDISSQVTWTSADPTVVTVSASGLLTAVGQGTTTVTASLYGVVSNSVTVAPPVASQSISFPSTAVTYGQPDFSPASTSSGLPVSYSQPSGACSIDGQGLVAVTRAGSCTVTASQPGNNVFGAATPVTQTFAVNPATLTVDANPASQIYGAASTALTYTLHGFVDGDSPAGANISGTGSCSIAAGTGTAAGTYPAAISCSPGSLAAPSYSFVKGASASLTITPATQGVTFTSSPPSPAKVGGSYTPAATGGGSKNPIVLSIDSSSAHGACAIASGKVSFTGVGICVIDANQAGNGNYQAAPQVTQKVTIGPATLTVTADSQTKLFGAANPKLTATITGFVNGQNLSTSGVTGSPSCSSTAIAASPGGTYPIACTIGTLSAPNYTFTTAPGTLKVGYTRTITGTYYSVLNVTSGQSVLLAPGSNLLGSINVSSGGALDMESDSMQGPLNSSGAAMFRICKLNLLGSIQITGSKGPVIIGDAQPPSWAPGSCPGITFSGPVNITNNTAGVIFDSNNVNGSVNIVSNTGTLPSPYSSTVQAIGNTVHGPSNIQH